MNRCDCCAPAVVPAPEALDNRPWLSALGYRIGTFATFREALIEELSRTPELAALRARVSDDYTITAIELWAAVADVLTFYQERIANESFLRTATLRDSLLRLVRLIDYELRPGAAATTLLAFTLENGARALIPAATRVQSVPQENEKPQKFETLADLAADAHLNRLRVLGRPQYTEPQKIGATEAFVAPDADALAAACDVQPGDRLALVDDTLGENFEFVTLRDTVIEGDSLALRWAAPLARFTPVSGERAYRLGRSFRLFGHDTPKTVVVSRLKTSADPTSAYLLQAETDYSLPGTGKIALDGRYTGLAPGCSVLLIVSTNSGPAQAYRLDISGVDEAPVEQNADATLSDGSNAPPVSCRNGTVTWLSLSSWPIAQNDLRNITVIEILGPALRLWPYAYGDLLSPDQLYLPGRRIGWSAVELERSIEKGKYKPGISVDMSDFPANRRIILTDAANGAVSATIVGVAITGSELAFGPTDTDPDTVRRMGLAADQAKLLTALVSAPLNLVSLPSAARSVQITIGSHPPQVISLGDSMAHSGGTHYYDPAAIAAALQAAIRTALPEAPSFARALVMKLPCDEKPGCYALSIVSGISNEPVSLAPAPNDAATLAAIGFGPGEQRWIDGLLSSPIADPTASFSGHISLHRGIDDPTDCTITYTAKPASKAADLAAALNAQIGRLVATARDDGRMVLLPQIAIHEPRSFLRLAVTADAPLGLDPATSALLGNVTEASHGESVRNEPLGNGDASQGFQRFTLRKKPVTFLPAATAGGVASSLRLMVDGVKWSEAATLYGRGPTEKVYVSRIADDGTLSVIFGDGMMGARLPSGRQNVVANYRQGIGVAGRVAADRLITLLDRPTGVKSATNPLAADGGADPETLERARQAAPGTVRTFGRAVSLHDFEDFALLAGEVAKVAATWVWTGERRAIHLTVAPQGGGSFTPDGLRRLAATLAVERDPNRRVMMDNYSPVAVLVDASLVVDDRYVAADVRAAAMAALRDALSFDRRAFAEPVYLSDVFRILQDVDGVIAVDVNILDLKSRDAAFRSAHGIDEALGQPQPRLLMLPARPAGSGGSVLSSELACVEVPDQDLTINTTGGLAS